MKVPLKYVNEIKDRYGKKRYYFRRNGKSYPLPADPTSPEFIAEHQRLLSETDPIVLPARVTAREGSLRALALQYYATSAFKNLEARTRHNYASVIDRFLDQHGHRMVADMRRKHVMKILGDMSETPGAANNLRKRLHTLCELAITIEWATTNPTTGIKAYKSGEWHTWNEGEIAQYEARWPVGSRQRLAFDVFLSTGQRVSDCATMLLPDASGKIFVKQDKTGAELTMSVHPRLAASMLAHPSAGPTILLTSFGKPFSIKGLGNYMSAAIRAAGLPERCVAHGLRKAAARRLAEAGCTDKEIMAVTGHTTLSEVTRYTRAANQAKMNQAAMDKLI